jgi:Ca2+-dependent lipid-binding protein
MTDYNSGILNIRIISAKLTRDTDTFSKMDPYITIIWDDQTGKQTKKTTAVCQDGGKTPNWEDEEFEIKIVNPGEDEECPTIKDSVVFRLWDEDISASDPIAFATVYFS